MITDIDGVKVGHWTNEQARTGCSVVIFPEGTVASGEIRGGAPASREFALLEPTKTVQHVDAVVLSGGSAFGLATADGVMVSLEEQQRGYETPYGRVPIVVGLSLFDLAVGDGSIRPGAAEGRLAVAAASGGSYEVGQVGAGTGATVNKWSGQPEPGGLGTATVTSGTIVVAALLAVNAYGAIDDGGAKPPLGPPAVVASGGASGNTTIGVVVTNAIVDKVGCARLAQGAHDGLARSLWPAHTVADGDGVVVGATGIVEADPFHLRAMVEAAVVEAIRSVKR